MRAFHPFKRSQRVFSLSPEFAAYQRTLKTLQDFTYDIIERRVEALQNGGSKTEQDPSLPRKKMAFLDTLLSSTIDGRPLTRQEIYEEVSTFMFEGHDTTTSGVSFAGYLLSRHPDVQVIRRIQVLLYFANSLLYTTDETVSRAVRNYGQ